MTWLDPVIYWLEGLSPVPFPFLAAPGKLVAGSWDLCRSIAAQVGSHTKERGSPPVDAKSTESDFCSLSLLTKSATLEIDFLDVGRGCGGEG